MRKNFLIISIFVVGILLSYGVYNVLAVAPTVSIYAVQTSIGYGESTIIGWSSTNASGGCFGLGGIWPGAKATSGTQSTGPLTRSKTYTLRCADDLGNLVTDSVAVNVAPAPSLIVSLTANPTSVTSGNSSTLSWSSTGFTDCSASGSWSGAKATSGSETKDSLTSAKTYTIGCYIADACLPSVSGTLWTSNQPGATNLGSPTPWCAWHSSKTSCDTAQASPGGTDPIQYVCEWTPASSQVTKTATVSVNASSALSVSASPSALYFKKNDSSQKSSNITATKAGIQTGVRFIANVPVNSYLDASIPPNASQEGASSALNTLSVGAGSATASINPYPVTVTVKGDKIDGTAFSPDPTANVNVFIMSGTISASDCVIASNAPTCPSTVTWSAVVPSSSTTEITRNNPDNTHISSLTANPSSFTNNITYGISTFYVYNSRNVDESGNAVPLASDPATATCASGTSWNGTVCSPTSSIPTVSTPTASCTSTTSANLGATIDSNGGASITSHGICLATNPSAVLSNCQNYSSSSTGPFTENRTGLTSGTTYYFAGSATNDRGTGYSSTYSFNCSAPPTPTGLSATPGACGTGKINLSWNASSGASSYKIKQGSSTLSPNYATTSALIEYLVDGATYTFSVAAKNSAGFVSAFSSPVTVVAPPACGGGGGSGTVSGTLTPSAYSCIIPSGGSGCYVNLSWDTVFQ